MKPELIEHLEEALQRGHEVQKFVAGLTLEQYSFDDRTRLAVERSFEMIGEALNRAFNIAPEQIDSIRNCRQIISFRNSLGHCYDPVEHRIVWEIIEGSPPELPEDQHELFGN